MNRSGNGFYCLIILSIFLPSGLGFNPFSYGNSTTECLQKPPQDEEDGRLLFKNHGFEERIEDWTVCGNVSISKVLQTVQLHEGLIYSFSTWVKIRKGSSNNKIGVVFRTENGTLIPGCEVLLKQEGCWSLLKGGIFANFSSAPVDIFLQSYDRKAEVSVENMSLQSFTKAQWRHEQDQVVDQIRKSRVRFRVTYLNETAARGAVVSINLLKPSFLFGCAMNFRLLKSKGYRDWFASRFKITSFTNEMKWYTTEKIRGKENYTLADAMLKFSQDNGILVRGHNILWDDHKYQPKWVKNITDPEDLINVTLNRINSVVTRYAGKLTGWDVMNENVHFRYFEDMLGENASASFYKLTSKLEPNTALFVNEFNNIEDSNETVATPANVMEKMEEILAYPGNEKMKGGIGLQGHFGPYPPNPAYMRSALDMLGSLGFPIWLTEVDILKCPDQVEYLEQILREAYSHPAVNGIIIFGGPSVSRFDKLTLADKDFKNTATGDLVDKLLKEWQRHEPQDIVLADLKDEEENELGFSPEVSMLQVSMLQGIYNVTFTHPWMKNFSTSLSLEVTKELDQQVVQVMIYA